MKFHHYEFVLNPYIVCCGVHFENAWIPNNFVLELFVQVEDPYLGIVLNTKETLPNFF